MTETPDYAGPFEPIWLDPADVAAWLRKRGDLTPADQAIMARVCVQTELYVERCRPEFYDPGTEAPETPYTPDGEVYQGAVMYAAREYRRRNSPAGTEQFAGGGAIFTAQDDDDINRALRTGPFNRPGVG